MSRWTNQSLKQELINTVYANLNLKHGMNEHMQSQLIERNRISRVTPNNMESNMHIPDMQSNNQKKQIIGSEQMSNKQINLNWYK